MHSKVVVFLAVVLTSQIYGQNRIEKQLTPSQQVELKKYRAEIDQANMESMKNYGMPLVGKKTVEDSCFAKAASLIFEPMGFSVGLDPSNGGCLNITVNSTAITDDQIRKFVAMGYDDEFANRRILLLNFKVPIAQNEHAAEQRMKRAETRTFMLSFKGDSLFEQPSVAQKKLGKFLRIKNGEEVPASK